MTSIQQIRIKRIEVVNTRRPLVPKRVTAIAESMAAIGLKTPITVRPRGEGYVLTVGVHRLEAAKHLGWRDIDCFVTSDNKIDRQMWSVAENLHRAHLTKLQRAEFVTRWNKLRKKRQEVVQDAHPGGRQPHDKGISRAAKKLGVSRDEIRRSEKISSISKTAKRAAKEAGLDDNQAALLKVAAEAPEAQEDAVKELAKAGPKKNGRLSRRDKKSCKALKHAFKDAKDFKAAWDCASTAARRRFIQTVLNRRPTKSDESTVDGGDAS